MRFEEPLDAGTTDALPLSYAASRPTAGIEPDDLLFRSNPYLTASRGRRGACPARICECLQHRGHWHWAGSLY
jgi:hypothetical protein